MKRLLVMIGLLLLFFPSTSFAEARIEVGEDAFIQIKGFIQPQLQVNLDPDATLSMDSDGNEVFGDAPDLTTDFLIRRARIIVAGQINKKVSFMLGTLATNWGQGGEAIVGESELMHFADAWVQFKAAGKALMVVVGSMKVPYTRHGMGAGGSIHGIDFHGKYVGHKVGYGVRDQGILVRGVLLDGMLDYRLGVFDGRHVNGESDLPRFVGRVHVSLFDEDSAMYFPGTYLGKKKVVTLGASLDFQPDAVIDDGGEAHAWSAVADLFADWPINKEMSAVLTMSAHLFGPGSQTYHKWGEGFGLWADFGFRYNTIEPILAFERFSPEQGENNDYTALMGGLNWWLYGHSANIKLHFGMNKVGEGDWGKMVILQTHLGY